MSSPARRRGAGRSTAAAMLAIACSSLANTAARAAEVDFSRDVYPALKANCIACHNKTTTKGALNLETPEAMRKGGESGAGLIPGRGAESPIFLAAAHRGDVEMPPKANKVGAVNFKPAEIVLLKQWIDEGAKGSVKQTRHIRWQALPAQIKPIYSVGITRDGRLAACGRGNQLVVYDLATRQCVCRLIDETLVPSKSLQGGAAHRALVQSLSFSPDGERLASGSFREVKIWRRQDAAVSMRKGDATLGSVASALSEDGERIACVDKSGTLRLLDAPGGKVLRSIPRENGGGVPLLSLSPDATKAAVYGNDGTLAVWTLADGKRIASKSGLSGVRVLTWTHDGKAVATAGTDKVVRVWPLPDGKKGELIVSKELIGATAAVMTLDAGADPNLLLAASADGKVRMWNLTTGKPVAEFNITGVVAVKLSNDGKLLAAGRGNGAVQIWDVAAGKSIIELSGDAETESRLAALDGTVAAAGLEATVQGEEIARIEADIAALDALLKKAAENAATAQKELVETRKGMKTASDAKRAAQQARDLIAKRIAQAPAGKPDAGLQVQRTDAQEKLAAAALAEAAAMTAFQAAETHLKDAEAEAQNHTAARSRNSAAAAAAKTASVKAKQALDKATADSVAIRKASAARTLPPLALRFSADAQFVAAVFGDGSLRVWAVASGRPVRHVPGGATTNSASITTDRTGAFSACIAGGSTTRVSASTRWVLERTLGDDSTASPFVDRVNAVKFSPDGATLAVGGGEPTRSGDISLWDVASGRLLTEWKERHSDAVLCLDFSPDGKLLASGGADKLARVTAIASGKSVHVFEGHTHHVLGVSFRADGRALAAAGADGVVTVWDMLSGERKKKIIGWSKEVTSLQFLGATNKIVASSGDKLIRIVNDNGGQVRDMANLADFMQSAAASTSANVIVAGGEDGLLRVWDGTNGRQLAAFGFESDAPPSSRTSTGIH